MASSAFAPTDPRRLIQAFCDGLWNGRDITTAENLLADDFRFHSSCGEIVGRAQFADYVRCARLFAERRYEIVDCVCEENLVFARVRVSFTRLANAASDGAIERVGAARFRCEVESTDVEWILGDLRGADPFFHFVHNRISDVWVSHELATRPSPSE